MNTSASTEDETCLTDDYGRKVRGMVRQGWPKFTRSISDNPFGVKMVDFHNGRSHLPDQAILQFYTLRAQFYVLPNDEATELSSPGDGLVRCDVADDNNDWCGHIVLNEDWARPRGGTKRHFIAMSEAKSFTQEECRNWAHYIPRAQEDVEWDLYYVLLIEWKQKRLLWERVGLGKVCKVAFKVGGSERQEEILLG